MHYSVKTINFAKQKCDCLIIGIFQDNQLSIPAKTMPKESHDHLTKVLKRGDMTGKLGQTLLLHDVPHCKAERMLLVGCGKPEELHTQAFRQIIGKTMMILKTLNAKDIICMLTALTVKDRDNYWKIRQAIEVTEDTLYSYNEYKTSPGNKVTLQKIIWHMEDLSSSYDEAVQEANAIAAGMRFTKDLGNTPPNICTPTYLAKQAIKLAKDYKNIRTSVLDEADMRKLGMGALLAVARGSHEPAKLIQLEYQGTHKTQPPIALVGKGVTFDSGGLSLKVPSTAMEDMKFDMCGAATVLGVFKAIAELKLPINVVGIIPATENLPGGNATKPSDVVKTLSGQTVEIMNTDAEGRLILCDALTYCAKFKPQVVIDIATLTGAVIIALGAVASGLFGNDERLISDLLAAGEQSADRAWQLPLWPDYQEQIDSNVADMMNIGLGGAKSITAACFLARFAKNFRWAHLDVAGTAAKYGKDKAATGRPVPLLMQFLLNYKY